MNHSLKHWNQLATRQDALYHQCAKRSGLPDAQFWVLYALCETEGLLRQNDFCESWCYSKQTTSAAVAGLEKAGLVSLRFAEGSRKQKELFLTPTGETFCDQYIRSVQATEEQVLRTLSPKARAAFFGTYADLLTKLEHAFQEER